MRRVTLRKFDLKLERWQSFELNGVAFRKVLSNNLTVEVRYKTKR